MKNILDIDDVIACSCLENYENQILVIKSESLDKNYRNAANQLFTAFSGFGCDPHKMGTAVYGEFLIDGEETRFERSDFLGIVKPDALAEWKNQYI